MRRAFSYLVGGLFVALAAQGLGCGGGGTSARLMHGPAVSAPRAFGGLVYTVSLPKDNYSRGEAVPVTFSVLNTGVSPVILDFPPCRDFGVQVNHDGQPVWAGPSRGCGGDDHLVGIDPGATKSYTITWSQTDSQGKPVQAGSYSLFGWLTTSLGSDPFQGTDQTSKDRSSNPVFITITP